MGYFSNTLMLNINTANTEVMIFDRSRRELHNLCLYNQRLKAVEFFFKYLRMNLYKPVVGNPVKNTFICRIVHVH